MKINQELIDSIFLRAVGETLICHHPVPSRIVISLDKDKKVIICAEHDEIKWKNSTLIFHPEGLTEAKEIIARELITIFDERKEKEERRQKYLEAKKILDELKWEFDDTFNKQSVEEELAYLKKNNSHLFEN